jgi:hypothetical protein
VARELRKLAAIPLQMLSATPASSVGVRADLGAPA